MVGKILEIGGGEGGMRVTTFLIGLTVVNNLLYVYSPLCILAFPPDMGWKFTHD